LAADWNRLAAGGRVFFAALAAGDVEEAPGVFVFFQEAFAGDDLAVAAAGSVGIEAEAFAGAGGFDGDDIPEVERGDVGGDEVDFFGGVDGVAVAAVFDAVAAVGEEFGAFGLNPVEAAVAVVDDEVVAFALSPGLADAEAHAGGAGEEGGFGGFGGFSAALAGGFGDGVEGEGLGFGVRLMRAIEAELLMFITSIFIASIFVVFVFILFIFILFFFRLICLFWHGKRQILIRSHYSITLAFRGGFVCDG
jgi:hypothetical protein